MDWVDHPLAGVILGFVFGLLSSFGLEGWREHVQARRVRTMLRLEVERNVVALAALDAQLPAPATPPETEETLHDRNRREWSELEHRALGLVDRPFPTLPQIVWTGQVGFLPRALTEEQIARLSDFFSAIDRLTVLHDALVTAKAASPDPDPPSAREHTPDAERLGPGSIFERRISQTRNDIRNLLQESISAGRDSLVLLRRRTWRSRVFSRDRDKRERTD